MLHDQALSTGPAASWIDADPTLRWYSPTRPPSHQIQHTAPRRHNRRADPLISCTSALHSTTLRAPQVTSVQQHCKCCFADH